jgi:hypothetical protein
LLRPRSGSGSRSSVATTRTVQGIREQKLGDVERKLGESERLGREASAAGAAIVSLPELFTWPAAVGLSEDLDEVGDARDDSPAYGRRHGHRQDGDDDDGPSNHDGCARPAVASRP